MAKCAILSGAPSTEKERPMTDKAAVTQHAWNAILEGPPSAGVRICAMRLRCSSSS